MSTIPDSWLKPKAKVDRTYLWTMLNTLHPDWVLTVTKHAYKSRFAGTLGTAADKVVTVSSEIAKILEAMPYLPSKLKLLKYILM